MSDDKLKKTLEWKIQDKGFDSLAKKIDLLVAKFNDLQQSMTGASGTAQKLAGKKTKPIADTENIEPQGGIFSRVKKFMIGDVEKRGQKGMFRSKTDITKPTGATGPGGLLTTLLTTLSPTITALLAIGLGIFSIIVSSSKMLQRTLGNIMKFIMMFIRPIGDMLAVLMMPLMMVLRPLALLINTMLRPYLQTARRWYRTGMQQQSMAKREERLGGSDEDVQALNDMAKESFSEGTEALGLGFGSFMTEIIANLGYLLTDLVGGFIALIPGVGDAVDQATDDIKDGITAWKEKVQDTNMVSLLNSQQELAGAQLVNTHLNTWISLGERLKSQGGEYKTVIEGISPAIKKVSDTYVKEGAIAASEVAASWTTKITEMLVDNGILSKSWTDTTIGMLVDNGLLSKSWTDTTIEMAGGIGILDYVNDIYWQNQLNNIGKADVKFGEVFDTIETKSDTLIDKLSGNTGNTGNTTKIAPEGNWGDQLAGVLQTLGLHAANIAFNASTETSVLGAMARTEEWKERMENNLAVARLRQEGYSREQVQTGNYGTLTETKATGGSIGENGMYYLHAGETVTNPTDASFQNTAGGSGGNSAPNIEFNNCTFGSFEEFKPKLDDYFSQQMRHMR